MLNNKNKEQLSDMIVGKLNYFVQINTRKIAYLNCGERYEDISDHCSYEHNLSSCEIKA